MLRMLLVVVAAGLVALAVWHPAPQPPLATVASSPIPERRHVARHAPARMPAADAVVYVVGAVARPGLYHLADGARINDAVHAAGGMRADADVAAVNLAARTNDGDEIVVPMLGEATPSAYGARARSSRSRVSKTHAIVDVNTASAQMLATVPGIGTTVAARIVQIRESDGAFATLDELLDVAGMTQTKLDRARAYLRV